MIERIVCKETIFEEAATTYERFIEGTYKSRNMLLLNFNFILILGLQKITKIKKRNATEEERGKIVKN